MTAQRTCSVDDCGRPHVARGLCGKHYQRLKKFGTTDFERQARVCGFEDCGRPHHAHGLCSAHLGQLSRGADLSPIWAPKRIDWVREVAAYVGDECRVWPDWVEGDRRPTMGYEGRTVIVARLILELASGPPPTEDYEACHKPAVCHNGGCCNPTHLYWGTHAENMADKFVDGTSGKKLTPGDVRAIRASSGFHHVVADRFGIHRETVKKIRTGQAWTWVE